MLRRPESRPLTLSLAALMLFAVLNPMSLSGWGLPDGATAASNSHWAVDTIAPVPPLVEAYHGFTRAGTDEVIYPLFHYVVLAVAYSPYIAYALLTGKLRDPGSDFPYGATNPAEFFVTLSLIAAFVSSLMSAGIVYWLWAITRELSDSATALAAATLTALMPPLTYYGVTSNLDVPYLFWTCAAVWFMLRAWRAGRLVDFVASGIAASLATATKDQAAGFLLLFPLLLPMAAWRNATFMPAGRETIDAGPGAIAVALLRDRRLWLALLAAAATFALANNLLFGGLEGFQRHLDFADRFYSANLANDPRTFFERQVDTASQSFTQLWQTTGPVFWLLVGWGLLHARRATGAWLLPAVCLVYYVAIIAPTIALPRYLYGVVLLAVPFAAFGARQAWCHAQRGPRLIAIVLTVLTLLGQLALIAHLHQTLRFDSRLVMEDWIRSHVPSGSVIESSTQIRYLPRIEDQYDYSLIGNSLDAVSYELLADDLSMERLAERRPQYILVLLESGLSGDPARDDRPAVRKYYDALLGERLGYRVVADFSTPTWLPWRQITSGTQPRSVLLQRMKP